MHLKIKSNKKNDRYYRDYSADFSCCGVEYDYHTDYNCEEECCDYICRCGRIVDAEVTDVDINRIIDNITDRYSEIDKYCVDRILRINKVYRQENWEVVVGGGYYGDEIEGVYLDQTLATKIEEEIDKVKSIKVNGDKIEYILILEYGHLLDSCKNKAWSIETIDLDNLILGNKDHYKKVKPCSFYHKYNLPRGIALREGDKFRLIDGHHRCLSCKDNEVKLIVGD